ncbi:MAG: DUF2974 domain-containing protein [Blautia sp.]|nr:DUF2974 domain-containing protein [Blautia sp.]
MANMLDYLDWRGDLPFSTTPMGEADALILSCLSYINYQGIVSEDDSAEVTLEQASERFFALHSLKELASDISFIRNMPSLLKKAASTLRYKDIRLSCYQDVTDTEKDVQFAAVRLTLPDGSIFLSFRGTDDTIVGWKEDFRLSVGRVEAQILAVSYTEQVLLDTVSAGSPCPKIYLGGHSKGGNLAEYAAAYCRDDIQKAITQIYDMDGPGFSRKALQTSRFEAIKDRVKFYVPGFSIIGMLMHHHRMPVVVRSSERTIMAHDAMTWQILGPDFVKLEAISETAAFFDASLNEWVDSLEADKRINFINDFFGVLEASGCKTLTELKELDLHHVTAVLQRLETVEPRTRKTVSALLRILMDNFTAGLSEEIRARLHKS